MKKIICFLLGHKKAVPMFYEDRYCIYIKGCPRCKKPVGLPPRWKNCPPLPDKQWHVHASNYNVSIRGLI